MYKPMSRGTRFKWCRMKMTIDDTNDMNYNEVTKFRVEVNQIL